MTKTMWKARPVKVRKRPDFVVTTKNNGRFWAVGHLAASANQNATINILSNKRTNLQSGYHVSSQVKT